MDQPHHQYMPSQQSHMSEGQPYGSSGSTSGSMSQYPGFHHQQAPVLQPAPGSYTQSPSSYAPHYSFPNSGLASPHGSTNSVSSLSQHMGSGLPPLPAMTGSHAQTYVGNSSGPGPNFPHAGSDPSGQQPPSNMKPKVTATLWEDEGCMCFQIETNGFCVARRDDNHMINGTKLLNVAGMTRGRRDGILKSEKTRNVVKIGPMHLKGVWIPFDRALEFANKEKITDKLYPLFVHNIGALLYHPSNEARTTAVMGSARRGVDSSKQPGGMVGPSGPQPPNLAHHHPMNSTAANHSPNSINTQGSNRPALDRAHTFPTPPTSASGTVTGMNNQWSSYESANGSMANSVPNSQYEHHPHSTPATPATTPPGSSLPSLGAYDNSRSLYGSNSQHSQYASHPGSRNGTLQSNGYTKQEMGPPGSVGPVIKSDTDHVDQKLGSYIPSSAHDHNGDEEADHDHDGDYPADTKYSYDAHRNSYSSLNGHTSSGQMGSLPNTSPSMWPGSYQSARAPPSSSLYNPTSDTRGVLSNGHTNSDAHIAGAYAPTSMNGLPSNKRGRDDDDSYSRGHDDVDAMKRRKMSRESATGSALPNGTYDNRQMNRPKAAMTPRMNQR